MTTDVYRPLKKQGGFFLQGECVRPLFLPILITLKFFSCQKSFFTEKDRFSRKQNKNKDRYHIFLIDPKKAKTCLLSFTDQL